MNKKKILILAPDFYGIDKSIQKAFKELGLDAILGNTRRLSLFERMLLKVTGRLSFPKKIIKFFLNAENRKYIAVVKKNRPDMLFVIKGETIFPSTLNYIKTEMKVPCVAYLWDSPFYSAGNGSVDDYRRNNFADGANLYDHIFVYDPYYVKALNEKGISQVSYLPLATDPDDYKKIEVSPNDGTKDSFDICFVGAPSANRIEILNSLIGFKLGVFGDGWKRWFWKRLREAPSYYRGKATGEKVLKIYSSSKIVLNIHDSQAMSGLNTRTFDIPACGAFELVDFKAQLQRLFNVGDEIACYKDKEDLKSLIRFYLNNPKARLDIAEKGRRKVLNSHTWLNRAREVIALLAEKGLIDKEDIDGAYMPDTTAVF